MAHDAPQAAGPTKLVIRNIGLLLSGALEKPILDADTIVAENGRITAIGKAQGRRHRRRHHHRRRHGHHRRPRPDRQPCASGRRRLDAAAEPDRLDRQLPARRRHHHDLGRRSPHARPSARHRRPQGDGDLRAARVLDAPPRRREGSRRRAGHRTREWSRRISRIWPRPASSCSAKSGSAASRTARPRGRWWAGRANTASRAPSIPAARRSPAPA